MGIQLQKLLEEERLKEHRIRLNKFTNEKYKWQKEIKEVDIKNIDELHMNFIQQHEDELSWEDIDLVRKVFKFIKEDISNK